MPPAKSRPNLLLITTDQQRWDTLGLNGNPLITTANLDHLAAGGINFSSAYSTTPSCIAARRTLLTGQHGATHGLPGYRDGQEFHPEYTLPGLLGQAGYQTQLIGKLHQFPQRKRYGFDHLILSEQIDHRPDSPFFAQNDYVAWLHDAAGGNVDPNLHGLGGNSRLARPFHLEERFHHSDWVVQEGIRFLTRRRDPSCPWFLHLSFWAPHPPLTPPAVYFDRYTRRADRWAPTIGSWACPAPAPGGLAPDAATGPFARDDMANAMAGYYGLVHHLDDLLGYFMQRVFGAGSPVADQPTWIIFTSDHGELLGDHHLFRKIQPYEGSTHVPLFIAGRHVDLTPGASEVPVCLEDVCPTLLDMAGLPIPAAADGLSLLPVTRGEAPPARAVIFGEHDGAHANHWVLADGHKYLWFARTNEEQLFDMRADPGETTDLSGEAARLAPFRERLAQRLAGRADYRYDRDALHPCAGTPPRVFWPQG